MNQAMLITPGSWGKMEQLEEPYLILDSTTVQDPTLIADLRKNYELKNHPKLGFNIFHPKNVTINRQNKQTKRSLDQMWRESEKDYDGGDQQADDQNDDDNDDDLNLDDITPATAPEEEANHQAIFSLNQPHVIPPPSPPQFSHPSPTHPSPTYSSPSQEQPQAASAPPISRQSAVPHEQPLSPLLSSSFIISDVTQSYKKESKSNDEENKIKPIKERSASANSVVCIGNNPPPGTFTTKKEKKLFGKSRPKKKFKGNAAQLDYVSSASNGKPALFLCDIEKVSVLDS